MSVDGGILVFRTAGDPVAEAVVAGLRRNGIATTVIDQIATGLAAFVRHGDAQVPGRVLVFGQVGGLPPEAIARAVRGLPGGCVPMVVMGSAGEVPGCDLLPRDAGAATILAHVGATVPRASDDDVFDCAVVRRMESLCRGAGAEIVEALQRDVVTSSSELRRLQTAGDLTAIARLAHRIKGSAGSAGAGEVARVCIGLEVAVRGCDRAATAGPVDAAIAAMARLADRLHGITI